MQSAIDPPRSAQQLRMRAGFHDPAPVEYQDPITMPNGREAVRDDE